MFQDTFKRSSYEFSLVLLELGITKLFDGLHECYLHDKVKHGFSFSLTTECYLIKHEHMTFNYGSLTMHYKMAFAVFKHIVKKHQDQVLDYFKNNESGDYSDLIHGTLLRNIVDDGCEERKDLPPPAFDVPPPVQGCKCLASNMTRIQLEELAVFVNNVHLNKETVTADDLADFFDCKNGFHIRVSNNRKVVLLLCCLCENALIGANWQHAVGENELIESSTGKKFLAQHDLSATLNQMRNKKRDPIEELIVEFAKKLKDVA